MTCPQCEVNSDLIDQLNATIAQQNQMLIQSAQAMEKANDVIKRQAQEINMLSNQAVLLRADISRMATAGRRF